MQVEVENDSRQLEFLNLFSVPIKKERNTKNV